MSGLKIRRGPTPRSSLPPPAPGPVSRSWGGRGWGGGGGKPGRGSPKALGGEGTKAPRHEGHKGVRGPITDHRSLITDYQQPEDLPMPKIWTIVRKERAEV